MMMMMILMMMIIIVFEARKLESTTIHHRSACQLGFKGRLLKYALNYWNGWG